MDHYYSMSSTQPYRIKTISEFHRLREFPKAKHPLISVLKYEDMSCSKIPEDMFSENKKLVLDFYFIALKGSSGTKVQYGQQPFDFDEGVMGFMGSESDI